MGTFLNSLELENINLTYPGLAVLQNMSFQIPPGTTTAILGPSGSGKTSLLGIIAGTLKPSSGRVLVDGKDCTSSPSGFGVMYQKDYLLEWKTLEENAALGILARGVTKKEALARVALHLEEFELSGFEKYYPHQLSGGMRQRAALLRTYLANPEALLLDEPLSAVDALMRRKLQFWLDDVIRRHKTTVVLVTHSLDEALTLASKVVIIQGRPGTLLDYSELPFEAVPAREREGHPQWIPVKTRLQVILDKEPFDRDANLSL